MTEPLRRVKIGQAGGVTWHNPDSDNLGYGEFRHGFPGDIMEVPTRIADEWLADGLAEPVA
jgi:hypothetical protein